MPALLLLRQWWSYRLASFQARSVAIAAVVRKALPDALFVMALLGGWTLLTWGLAALLSWKVWPISFGLFLLSCCGWRMLWVLASQGLYALSQSERQR